MNEYDICYNDTIILYDDFSVIGSSRVYWMMKCYNKECYILNENMLNLEKRNIKLETGNITYKKR